VKYREVGTTEWYEAKGGVQPVPRNRLLPARGFIHRALVKGLKPGTEYEYQVSGDVRTPVPWSPVYRTRTAPAPGGGSFSFAFITDTCLDGRLDNMATGAADVVREIAKDDPNLVLGVGDYACANHDGRYSRVSEAVDAWFRQMEPVLTRAPLMTQYGNHEIYIDERFQDWAPRYAHPEGFDHGKNYSFDIGNAHFAAVFVPLRLPSEEILAWLDADLADARRRGMKWLIVYQHEPIYSNGAAHPVRPEITKAMQPIFAKYKVDLHLSGQDRNFERTYPLVGTPEAPVVASRSLDSYQAGEGVIYAKAGPSGAMSEQGYNFSKFTVAQPDYVAVWNDTAYHYALVTVSDDALQVQIFTLDGNGAPKRLRDEFTIHAGPAAAS
jgi:hypothetical protein